MQNAGRYPLRGNSMFNSSYNHWWWGGVPRILIGDIEWRASFLYQLGMLTHLSVLQQVSIEHLLCAQPPVECGE